MTEKKLDYLSPETEALIVKFEGVICESQTGEQVEEQVTWPGSNGWS